MSDRPAARQRLSDRLSLRPRALPEDTRRSNRSAMLRALHHGGPASRADLAKLIGVTPATVSAITRDLIDEDLVEELGTSSGSVGKPPTLIGIRADGAHVVAIGMSEPDRFVGAIVDLAGKVISRRTYERDGRTGAEAHELVGAICDDLIADATRPVAGVGLASPGIVDPSGVVVRAARLGWSHVALAPDLAMRTGLPVHAVNDANASALAELTFGSSDATNFVLVRVDQGVGAGLVLDGDPFVGANAAAGEIGHVVIDPGGALCTCGKRGCLETVISAPLLDRSSDGDDLARDALDRAGRHLGNTLATMLSVLDVTDVVLSGPAQISSETFRSAVVDAIAERTLPEIGERVTVRPTTFGDDDVILGAAALVLDRELGIR